MNELIENELVEQIRNEYKKIDCKWLNLQFRTFIGLILFGFLTECVIGAIWYLSGHVSISAELYFLKYILLPLAFHLTFILVAIFVMKSVRIPQKTKAYVTSLLFVAAGTVFYTAHGVFNALQMVFAVPILLTIVYADYKLTSTTALACLGAKILSDLALVWDPEKEIPLNSALGTANFWIAAFILVMTYAACIVVIQYERKKADASIEKEIERYRMQQKLHHDDLTQIFNRTALRKAFQTVVDDESDNAYQFVMIDIDRLKQLNDTFGHDKGDECLVAFSEILRKYSDPDTMPFRFGGDEFCVLFKNKGIESVMDTCKGILDEFRDCEVSKTCMPMTASIGIAPYEKHMSATELLRNTDFALYQSKEKRDCISVFECTA